MPEHTRGKLSVKQLWIALCYGKPSLRGKLSRILRADSPLGRELSDIRADGITHFLAWLHFR